VAREERKHAVTTPAFNPFLLLARWAKYGVHASAKLAVQRAICDFGVMEAPPGSNRGALIDEYNVAAGAPVPDDPHAKGPPYCASAVTAWYRAAGLETPPMDAAWWVAHNLKYLPPCSCDAWRLWALLTDRFLEQPVIGAAILYGEETDATHMGIVIRVDPIWTLEANTSIDGRFNREGVAFDRKILDRHNSRVIGFVSPFPTPLPPSRSSS
jgi:hypothetical protein